MPPNRTIYSGRVNIAGCDPNSVMFNPNGGVWFEDEAGLRYGDKTWDVKAAFAALKSAILSSKLKVKVIHDSRPVDNTDSLNLVDMMECGEYFSPDYEHVCEEGEFFRNGYFIKSTPNWGETMISVDEIRAWLAGKGVTKGFFFANLTNAPDYLDPQSPRYAPKLAAAVKAWQAVTDPVGKHPKQALTKWLREHAVEFDLTDDEGKPNETGIEEVAKVANWQLTGGAAKTPGK